MNTFKKLIFGLLLSGLAFTAACNDDKDPVKENGVCSEENTCDQNLACVVAKDGDKSGKCQKVCKKDDDCGDATKECSKAVKTVDKKDAKQCKAKAGGGDGQADVGAECDGSTPQKTCKTDTKCYMGHCYATCTTKGEAAAECNGKLSGKDGTTSAPDCMDGELICVEHKEPVDLGGKCVAGDTCKDDGKCQVDSATATEGVCVKDCVDSAACATADATKPVCATEGLVLGDENPAAKICIAKREVGKPCSAEAICVDTAKCVNAGPHGLICALGCAADASPDPACSAADPNAPNCKTAKDVGDADVFVCQP